LKDKAFRLIKKVEKGRGAVKEKGRWKDSLAAKDQFISSKGMKEANSKEKKG